MIISSELVFHPSPGNTNVSVTCNLLCNLLTKFFYNVNTDIIWFFFLRTFVQNSTGQPRSFSERMFFYHILSQETSTVMGSFSVNCSAERSHILHLTWTPKVAYLQLKYLTVDDYPVTFLMKRVNR